MARGTSIVSSVSPSISRGGGLRYLQLCWRIPLGNPGRVRWLFSDACSHLRWQVLHLGFMPQSKCAIFFFSEAGSPSLTVECADDVALRVGVTHAATSDSVNLNLGPPPSFSKGSPALMAPSLGHAVPGSLSLALPSVMQMGRFH